MNRKQNYKWLLSAGLAIVSLSAFGTPANAQQVRGSFTLPCAVQWGHVTLPSGSYTFESQPRGERNLILIVGQHRSAFVLARSASPDESSGSRLRLIRTGHQATVSSLHLGPAGVTFNYLGGQHPNVEQEAANHSAQQPRSVKGELAELEIPVGTSGQ